MYKNFDSDYIVCSCSNTSLAEIIYAIQAQKATTIDDLIFLSDAGSICKCCTNKEDDYTDRKKIFLSELLEHFTR